MFRHYRTCTPLPGAQKILLLTPTQTRNHQSLRCTPVEMLLDTWEKQEPQWSRKAESADWSKSPWRGPRGIEGSERQNAQVLLEESRTEAERQEGPRSSAEGRDYFQRKAKREWKTSCTCRRSEGDERYSRREGKTADCVQKRWTHGWTITTLVVVLKSWMLPDTKWVQHSSTRTSDVNEASKASWISRETSILETWSPNRLHWNATHVGVYSSSGWEFRLCFHSTHPVRQCVGILHRKGEERHICGGLSGRARQGSTISVRLSTAGHQIEVLCET